MSHFKKFIEQLPCKKKFYSSLAGKNVSYKEYERVFNVWNKFEMKTMKDHQDLYLKYVNLFLADVFEKFRNNSLKNHKLCPSHSLSAQGLSWYVMLKMTKVVLQLIPDPDMYVFFGKGKSGGISYTSNKYS